MYSQAPALSAGAQGFAANRLRFIVADNVCLKDLRREV
jgi:hypothetical protein